jgi:hypothetical protein
MAHGYSLDVPGFDAKAAMLELRVGTTHEVYAAVFVAAYEVTAAIGAPAAPAAEAC